MGPSTENWTKKLLYNCITLSEAVVCQHFLLIPSSTKKNNWTIQCKISNKGLIYAATLKTNTAHSALYGPYNVWTREVWAFGRVNGAVPLVVPRRVPVEDAESGVGGVGESTVTEFTRTPNYRSRQIQLYSLFTLLNSDR